MGQPKPRRTCVACREEAGKHDLVRYTLVDGMPVPDPTGRAPGRGAYVHDRDECRALAARRRSLERALAGRSRIGAGEAGG